MMHSLILTDEAEAFVAQLIDSGRYQDADEVFSEGLRQIEAREAEDTAKIEALRAAALEGIDAIERGDFRTFSDPEALEVYIKGIVPE